MKRKEDREERMNRKRAKRKEEMKRKKKKEKEERRISRRSKRIDNGKPKVRRSRRERYSQKESVTRFIGRGSVMDEAHASSLRYLSENEIESPWILSLNLQDTAESVRDAIGFEYCLASSSRWTKLTYDSTLEDITRACVIDFGGSYHLSIQCAPFEALYGRKCRSLVLWAENGESSLFGPELVLETTDKVVLIKERLKAVSPWKGIVRFGKKGKLAPRYIGPFEILKRIGLVAYRLSLSEELSSVHDTFHVSNLKKCLTDANLYVPLNEIKVDKTLRFVEEPVEIMDREIKKLKRRKIALVKVRWNSKRGPEFTWEHQDQMRIKYPQLFMDRVVEPAS
ncbi:hypothetical protein Tco_0687290 [Tanacetum coccineum]